LLQGWNSFLVHPEPLLIKDIKVRVNKQKPSNACPPTLQQTQCWWQCYCFQGTYALYCIDEVEQSLSCWGAEGLQALWAGWLCGRPFAPAQSACKSPG
jgi:hypothetical protein